MNYICTWLCVDEVGEESYFPNTGRKSSGRAHQDIYWRCLVVFFITSKRLNKEEKHLLFTNSKSIPNVDGIEIGLVLHVLGVEIIHTPFEYKTPKGYYKSFQNQFYEFSILKYIATQDNKPEDKYLILDSDCVFFKGVRELFEETEKQGTLSFAIDYEPDRAIHGLSRREMKDLFEELLNQELEEVPPYLMGEFFLSDVKNIKKIFSDFEELWPKLLEKNSLGLKKFNEEAHTLSFLFFKNGRRPSKKENCIKRIWTNPIFYRNVSITDLELTIGHLPGEKTFGFATLFKDFVVKSPSFRSELNDKEFVELLRKIFGIPYLSASEKKAYVYKSCLKGFKNLWIGFNLKRLWNTSKKLWLIYN